MRERFPGRQVTQDVVGQLGDDGLGCRRSGLDALPLFKIQLERIRSHGHVADTQEVAIHLPHRGRPHRGIALKRFPPTLYFTTLP